MKLFTILFLIAGSFVHSVFGSEVKEDNSPNANSLLRSPSSQGTNTKEGASFGPEPVLRNSQPLLRPSENPDVKRESDNKPKNREKS